VEFTRVQRELKKVDSQKINDQIRKSLNELNRYFSKESVKITKKHMKRCSTSLP
jgi:hypothetical protein